MKFLLAEVLLCAGLLAFGLAQTYEATKDLKRLLKKHEKK